MRLKHFKAAAAALSVGLVLTACQSGDASGNDFDDGAQDPVYTEIASWDACEVLDHLQPITDYMDIKGYGSLTSEGGEPGNQEVGNTLDPEAIGCGNLIFLGSYEGLGMDGEIKVKIIPVESEDEAATEFEERTSVAESSSSEGDDAEISEFSDPWDQGAIVSWVGEADAPHVEVIAQDSQWLFHIQLYHSYDYGLNATGDPALSFTPGERNKWFVETYLPEVNQLVNDRLAEVQ